MHLSPAKRRLFIGALVMAVYVCGLAASASGQDILPRRWSHLPVGTSFGGLAVGYTTGEIYFDPALRIEDTEFDLRTYGLKYIHSFEMLGKTARLDFIQSYHSGTWTGLVNGVPTVVRREGWGDTLLRCSVNLLGGPPLAGREYVEYRKSKSSETLIGAGLIVQLPTGEYYSDKLINLGSNRFTIRPQIGIVHQRGRWSYELTSAIWFYTDNNAFFGGTRLEQDPSFGIDAHVIYTIRPGLWLAAGMGYLVGEESWVSGTPNHNSKKNVGWGIGLGVPLSRALGFRLNYVGTRTGVDSGADMDTVSASLSLMW